MRQASASGQPAKLSITKSESAHMRALLPKPAPQADAREAAHLGPTPQSRAAERGR